LDTGLTALLCKNLTSKKNLRGKGVESKRIVLPIRMVIMNRKYFSILAAVMRILLKLILLKKRWADVDCTVQGQVEEHFKLFFKSFISSELKIGDLPTCSIAPRPFTLLRAPQLSKLYKQLIAARFLSVGVPYFHILTRLTNFDSL
jgi:hypothetical protein